MDRFDVGVGSREKLGIIWKYVWGFIANIFSMFEGINSLDIIWLYWKEVRFT
jgi:hypothetical protein